MPYRAPHPCSQPGCAEKVHERFCTIHRKNQERRSRQRRGTTAERGYGAGHKKWRMAVLRKADADGIAGLCVMCLEDGRTTVAKVADHIVPLSQGGAKYDMDNGQALCKTHHDLKTLSEGSFGRAYIPTSPEIGQRLTIVCGPPRAGKNTYVDKHAAGGDIERDMMIRETVGWA